MRILASQIISNYNAYQQIAQANNGHSEVHIASAL